ncbi:MAG: hypothetical protein IKK63_02710 [Clostridia bacterium]|nr:hypothetical protein [Clostridia bacterium]MBR3819182.1 hypothetical protein [Clostridia bacterium]
MKKLVKNAIQCKLCGDIIESTYTHNFVRCSCGSCAVDGGLDYQKFCCKNADDIINLAEYENTDES